MNNQLRKQVKLLKALQGISYKEVAEYLEITTDSFYSWLHNYYDLSQKKQHRLKQILEDLSEV